MDALIWYVCIVGPSLHAAQSVFNSLRRRINQIIGIKRWWRACNLCTARGTAYFYTKTTLRDSWVFSHPNMKNCLRGRESRSDFTGESIFPIELFERVGAKCGLFWKRKRFGLKNTCSCRHHSRQFASRRCNLFQPFFWQLSNESSSGLTNELRNPWSCSLEFTFHYLWSRWNPLSSELNKKQD